MAKLPIYNSQGGITTQTPTNLRNPQDYNLMGNALQNTSKEIQRLTAEWQQAKDQVENLDGKNKLLMGISDILTEAEQFNSWSSPKELEAKKQELSSKLQGVLPSVMDGFSNNQNAVLFQKQGEFATFQNQVKLDEIFRDKEQDKAYENIEISKDMNFRNFIQTGDKNYKQSYFNDIDMMVNAGFMTRKEATKLTQETDKWGVYHVLNLAETNPDAAIQALKSGQYGIRPEDYHETLKSVTSIKTNQKLLQDYQERVRQDNFESEALNYVTSNNTYADKIRYIDEAELNGNISESYAAKLRRGIRSENPNKQKSISNATALSDLMQQAYDLNNNEFNNEEYLKGIKNIRDNVLSMQQQGLICTKDANTFNRQLDSTTRNRISQATNGLSYSAEWKEARNYINSSVAPELKATVYRDLFYATQDVDLQGKSKKEIREFYKKQAISIVDEMKTNNRQRALETKSNFKNTKQNIKGWAF